MPVAHPLRFLPYSKDEKSVEGTKTWHHSGDPKEFTESAENWYSGTSRIHFEGVRSGGFDSWTLKGLWWLGFGKSLVSYSSQISETLGQLGHLGHLGHPHSTIALHYN